MNENGLRLVPVRQYPASDFIVITTSTQLQSPLTIRQSSKQSPDHL
jgi:hypothetical protein